MDKTHCFKWTTRGRDGVIHGRGHGGCSPSRARLGLDDGSQQHRARNRLNASQVYTQGLHRREFEVGYTHRRERALKEGEDASIELARQMEAQV